MPDTPTPRAVLARAFTNELKRMLGDDPLPDGKPPFIYVGPESDLVLAVERDYLAALVASAGPLDAGPMEDEEYAEYLRLRERIETELSPSARRCLNELVGQTFAVIGRNVAAYTALAVECAQVTKERDRWMGRFDNEVHASNKLSDDLAALRATVATWHEGFHKIRHLAGDGLSEAEYRTPEEVTLDKIWTIANDHMLSARTPTPEGQG